MATPGISALKAGLVLVNELVKEEVFGENLVLSPYF
jgi:hypothetical protein